MSSLRSCLGIALLLPITAIGSAEAPKLHVGDPLPAYKVGKWLKGEPVAHLEKGKVYVIDFWGIRCPPCIEAIPHVSALAKKYTGKATFIGLSLTRWTEQEPYPDGSMHNQILFVKEHKKDIDYHIVTDTPKGYMATHVLEALGLDSIPHAIVVDRKGKIAWVGEIEGLDAAVSKAIAR